MAGKNTPNVKVGKATKKVINFKYMSLFQELARIKFSVPIFLCTNLANLIQDSTRIIEAETRLYQVSIVLTPIEECSRD